MKRALIFPGQGSQYVGMGQDIFERHASVRELYATAQKILGYDIAKISFHGPLEELTETQITQPALFIASAAYYSLLPVNYKFELVAGHSLGEYSALFAAGVLNFEAALSIVKVRAEGMHAAGESQDGSMAAILNMSRQDVEQVCHHAAPRGIVQAANFNSPGQIVISGETAAVYYAMEVAKNLGARKAVALNVSGAFHSPLMAPAVADLRRILDQTEFKPAAVPVIANVTAQPATDPGQIKELLLRQLESPVLWEDSVKTMLQLQVEDFVEIGPGRVLQGLIRRIERKAQVSGISSLEQLEGIA